MRQYLKDLSCEIDAKDLCRRMRHTNRNRAGKTAAGWAIDASVAASADAPDTLKAKGANVHIASDAENKALEAEMRPAFDAKFKGNDDAAKLIELIGKM